MKTQRPEEHLTYDDLLKALAGADDLAEGKQAHLKACASCRQSLARVERRFSGIGRMARKMAPEPSRPFRLPEKRRLPLAGRFNPILATGAAIALIVLASTWLSHRMGSMMDTTPAVTVSTLEQDKRLMEEVDALVNNALPESFQSLASFSDLDLDEDLINWIVPSIDEDDNSLT